MKKLKLQKDKEKIDYYCRGMANALYIFANINNIYVEWAVCYEIAYDSIFSIHYDSLDGLDFYLKNHYPNMFYMLQDERYLAKFRFRAERRRIFADKHLTPQDVFKLESAAVKKFDETWKTKE